MFSVLQRRNEVVLVGGNPKRVNLVPVVGQKKIKNEEGGGGGGGEEEKEEGELELDGALLNFGLWRSSSLRFWSERRPKSLRR